MATTAGIKLTTLEQEFMTWLKEDDFIQESLDDEYPATYGGYEDCPISPRSRSGVVSSLIKKGVIDIYEDDPVDTLVILKKEILLAL